MGRKIRLAALAFGFGHRDLVEVANCTDHLHERHGTRAVLVNFVKPVFNLLAVKVCVESVHLVTERLEPKFRFDNV